MISNSDIDWLNALPVLKEQRKRGYSWKWTKAQKYRGSKSRDNAALTPGLPRTYSTMHVEVPCPVYEK